MMKKFTAIMMALMMVLTLTQCKPDKGNEGDTPNGSKVKVSCVIPMNKNTRSEFTNLMTDGSIKWSAGTERIYLAIPNETNPQIVELTAFTTVESNILLFEGEVEAGLLTEGEYEVWYLGNSKESGNSYITEEIENEVIKSISGSIASQSGDLNDLGYCHIAMTTVTAETEGEEVVLSLNGTLKNQIAIAHLDLEGITNLKGDAIVGTEYALQYNNGAFEFAVTEDASANINVTEGTTASYVVLFPNATANVDLKSNTSKKVTFEGGVEANKIYYKHVSDMEFYPLTWEDYEEETNTINGHEYVDLGLPSGLLWATCNIGAETPEEVGGYYSWGGTTDVIYGYNYRTSDYSLFADISGHPQLDAATANWGDDWRMPTKDEMNELKENCTWEWTANGYKVTSKTNGNYIFLPIGGRLVNDNYFFEYEDIGFYWSSTPDAVDYTNFAYYLWLAESAFGIEYDINTYRYFGMNIRPVSGGNFEGPAAQCAFVDTYEVSEITATTAICGGNVTTDNGYAVTAKGICWSDEIYSVSIYDETTTVGSGIGSFTSQLTNLKPNTTYYVRAYATNSVGTSYGEVFSFTTKAGNIINGHEYVDLGLSVKWATCNVGANAPEEYGDYFAWGETETKETYISDNCSTSGVQMSDISGNAKYDAAASKWGGNWRMPTKEEMEELKNQCTWTPIVQNGVKGYNVTSNKNGNSIFLPVAGYRLQTWCTDSGSAGYYWCSAPSEYSNGMAYFIHFRYSNNEIRVSANGRSDGYTIRPVLE